MTPALETADGKDDTASQAQAATNERGPDAPAADIAAPQPGDAERLGELREFCRRCNLQEPTSNWMFLFRLIDAAQSAPAYEKGNTTEAIVQINKTLRENQQLQSALAESRAEVARLEDRLVEERLAGFRLAEHQLTYHARKDSTADETKRAFHIAACWLSKRSTELGAADRWEWG